MNRPHREVTAPRRFWVVVFVLVSLGVVAGGLAYYRYEQGRIRQEKYQELAAIADLKVRQILEWRRERLADAHRMTRGHLLSKGIADYLQDPGNQVLRAALLDHFKVELESENYENVLLVAPDGRVLLSVPPDPACLCPPENQVIDAALAGRQASLSDFFLCPQANMIRLDAVAPVLDSQGRPLAVVILRAAAEKVLYPLIQSWPTPSRTAETLLVKVEGEEVLYLNDLRHHEKTALSLRVPLTRTDLPSVQAILGKQGMFEGKDYRGIEVLADLRPVPQSPWFMVAKVNRSEILAEAKYRAGVAILFVGLFILLTAAATAYGHRQRHVGLLQDLYLTERERRQVQEEFRTILYSIGDAVITTDTAGRVKQMNREAQRLTGWLEAEARGKALEEVFPIVNEETRSPVENPVHRVLREGEVVGLGNHTLLIARDGAQRPIADSAAPIRDESGAVMGVVLIFRDQTQERAAEKALRESEEQYRLLVDQSPDAILVDRGGKIVFVNPAGVDLLGAASPAEIVGRNGMDLVHPDFLEIVRQRVKAIFSIGRDELQEIKMLRLDGTPLDVEVSAQVISYQGHPAIQLMARDITTRKRAEEALRASEERYRTVAEYTYDMEYWVNEAGKVLYMSPACERLTGYPAQAFLDDPLLLSRSVHPQDLNLFTSHRKEAISGEKDLNVDFRLVHRDGREFWVNHTCRAVFGIDGRPLGRRASNRDITARKHAEVALKDHLNFLQTLLDTIPSPIFYKNFQGIYLGCNDAFSDFLGLPKEEIIGKSTYDLSPQELADKYFEMDAALFRQPGVQRYDFSVAHADGTLHEVNFNKATYATADGALAGLVGVMVDITDRKKAEVERLHFSKLESLGTLAGGIAHDFNNILTAILGNISLARLDPQNEEATRKRLNATERACQEAQKLSQQLLTFARGGAPIKELVAVENLVTETGAFACRGSKARITFSFPDNLWAVEADPGQISQVIQNLVINALQAMPTGGTITVQGENLVVAAPSDLPLGAGKYVKISLQDQGVGIPAHHLARIFDPYFTTKQTGSGLGLATAYSIVNSHDGHMAVESTLGVGTTFHIYLPAVAGKIRALPDQEMEVMVGQGKILVMDDEEMVRHILGKMLSRLGYEAKLARHGAEAMELFTLAQESGKAFDAVILDLTVPGGMGGKETMEKLLKIDPRVKAIVSSGYSHDSIMAEFAKYGFSGVIAKPYRISDLSKVLNTVIAMGK